MDTDKSYRSKKLSRANICIGAIGFKLGDTEIAKLHSDATFVTFGDED
jgi:hypothetical protein